MKTRFLAFTAAALSAIPTTFAMQPAREAPAASVEFLEPENFTDFRMSEFGSASERSSLETELRKDIEKAARRHLPPGYHLNLRFRDIDMAGDFEPWLGPRFSDIRIVREIYPPRMDVEWSIVNEVGDVVTSGKKQLIDMAHMWRLRLNDHDSLASEADLLDDFIRDISRALS